MKKLSSTNLIIVLWCIGIIYAPLVVDYSALPKGWELPKVEVWQIIGLSSIALLVVSLIRRKAKLSIKALVTVMIVIVLVSTSSVINFYSRNPTSIGNNFYQNLLQLGINPQYLNISVWGSEFWDRGLITILIILLGGYALYKSITKKNLNLIFLAFIASSCIQSAIVLVQFINYAVSPTQLISSDRVVFGTFGQPNFLAGHLLIGLIFTGYFLYQKRIRHKLIGAAAMPLICLGIIFSQSYWMYIVGLLALITMFLYRHLSVTQFKRAIKVLGLTGIVVGIIAVVIFLNLFPDYTYRLQIWKSILSISFSEAFVNPASGLVHLLFGWGQNSLGPVMSQFGKFPGSIVDQAHNFLLDIMVSTGLTGITIFGLLLKSITQQFERRMKDPTYAFALLALAFWLLRSLIHESSIINLNDLITSVAIAAASRNFLVVTK